MNLVGKRFGRLTVISESDRKGYVLCKCDCGNLHTVRLSSLTKSNHPTISCGCYRKEVVRETGRNTIHKNSAERIAANAKYGTNLGIISNPNPNRRNKSGYTGVWYDQVHGVYQAYITLHRTKYALGTYKHIQDAIDARKEAEEKYFAPIIEARNAELSAH